MFGVYWMLVFCGVVITFGCLICLLRFGVLWCLVVMFVFLPLWFVFCYCDWLFAGVGL